MCSRVAPLGLNIMAIKSMALAGAALVGALVLGIGIVGKTKPTLFMGLPFPLSIILWTSFGGEMPPFFMPDAWHPEEIKTWTKPGDLVVTTGSKSGTTWMLFCTHQIRMKGSDDADELFPDVSITTPWPDFRQSRHGSWEINKNLMNTTILPDGKLMTYYWDNPRYPFRIFKSHYTPMESGGVLPIKDNPQLKFLAMARNGLDVVNSFVFFWHAHTDNFRNVFGGFPPASSQLFLFLGCSCILLYFCFQLCFMTVTHMPTCLPDVLLCCLYSRGYSN